MTQGERLIADALRKSRLPFRQEHHIGPFTVDFWIDRTNIIVEVDGETHLSADRLVQDKKRDKYLLQHGYVIRHVTNTEAHIGEFRRQFVELLLLEVQGYLQHSRPQPDLTHRPFEQLSDSLPVEPVIQPPTEDEDAALFRQWIAKGK